MTLYSHPGERNTMIIFNHSKLWNSFALLFVSIMISVRVNSYVFIWLKKKKEAFQLYNVFI